MFRPLLERIRARVRGDRALEAVREIARHHRIQSSPGYEAAAAWLAARVGEIPGLRLELEHVAGDGRTRHLGYVMPEGWECTHARGTLVAPGAREPLADFGRAPLSLVQRSAAASGRWPLVNVEAGVRTEDYEGVEVRDRVVLAHGAVQRVHEQAVLARGAAGIVAHGRRLLPPTRTDEHDRDSLAYTSYWWAADMPRSWGFVVSPARGAELRARLAAGEPLEVEADIATRRFSAEITLVSAVLPGELPGEIMVTSHLCHPRPGANDNASGVAATLEAARVLEALAAAGELPVPRRSVRFLWMPEFSGTYAWLGAGPERALRTVAAVNLDMVGEDQTACGSTQLLERAPHFLGSFAEEFALQVRQAALAPGRSDGTRLADAPFSGGSDHAVWLDPDIGVPCPMLIQWPDRYYHSDLDTPERCDPESLAHAARFAAAYAAFLAGAGVDEVHWLADAVARGARRRIVAAAAGEQPETRARAERLRGETAIASLARLALDRPPGDRVRLWLDAAVPMELDGLDGFWELEIAPLLPTADARPAIGDFRVPVRRARGLLSPVRWLADGVDRLSPESRGRLLAFDGEWAGGSAAVDVAWFACDGRRTIAEIAALVSGEGPAVDERSVAELFEVTSDLGATTWAP